jgi:hypothetical protein
MLRMLRPDLLCGLGGFVLGAAALLLTHGVAASAPPPAAPRTDILTLAAAKPAPVPRPADAG